MMYFFPNAISLIKKYETYYSEAEVDTSDDDVYEIGYGLNYYPDGTPVKQGQKITKKKADQYLEEQVQEISNWIHECKLDVNASQHESLVSFIHSIGIDTFENSLMFGLLEDDKILQAAEEFTRWIYDENGYAMPLLIERRRQEKVLFLSELVTWDDFHSPLLLDCFKTYSGAIQQDMAINYLEQKLDPYLLAEFFNIFKQNLQQPTGGFEVGLGNPD